MATLLALLVTARASAGGDDIVADRPGFGESASVVASRHVQVETGLAWTRVSDEMRIFDLPQALLRLGLGRSLELRLVAPDWLRSDEPGRTASGWSDTAVGLKWHVAAGGGDLSLRGTLYLDTGSVDWTAGKAEPEVAVAWSHALSERWSLGTTVSARRLRILHHTLLSPSVSLGRSLGSRVSTFVEYGANLAEGLSPLHRIDHGYAWLPNPDTQLDVSLGVGLSATVPDFFVGFGFSRRF
jgi:hypothetical protein